MSKLKLKDNVRIKGNAQRTIWESGFIEDINESGYLIRYGRHGMLGCYGLGIRKQRHELELIKE